MTRSCTATLLASNAVLVASNEVLFCVCVGQAETVYFFFVDGVALLSVGQDSEIHLPLSSLAGHAVQHNKIVNVQHTDTVAWIPAASTESVSMLYRTRRLWLESTEGLGQCASETLCGPVFARWRLFEPFQMIP